MNAVPILLSVISAGATLTGGVVALRVRDRLHLVLGAVAGVVLGVVLFDLLPEALKGHPQPAFGVPAPLLTLAAGFLLVHLTERLVATHRGHEHEYARHRHVVHAPGIGLAAGGRWWCTARSTASASGSPFRAARASG